MQEEVVLSPDEPAETVLAGPPFFLQEEEFFTAWPNPCWFELASLCFHWQQRQLAQRFVPLDPPKTAKARVAQVSVPAPPKEKS